MRRPLELRRKSDGTYYAHDVQYPYIGHPASFGSKAHAQTYIASWYGLTLNEYKKERTIK